MKTLIAALTFALATFSQSIFADSSSLASCSYSAEQIKNERDELVNWSQRVYKQPNNFDALLSLEIARARIDKIEKTKGCEIAKDIFGDAKEQYQFAKENRKYFYESIGKSLRDTTNTMREIDELMRK